MAVNCDPSALVSEAACFRCVPKEMHGPVLLYLLCQILENGGGGGNVNACLIAQSGAPTDPCAFTFGLAYDNDYASPTSGSFWYWDSVAAEWVNFIT